MRCVTSVGQSRSQNVENIRHAFRSKLHCNLDEYRPNVVADALEPASEEIAYALPRNKGIIIFAQSREITVQEKVPRSPLGHIPHWKSVPHLQGPW